VWQRLQDQNLALSSITDVAAGGPTSIGAAFVAVGRTRTGGDPETADWRPAAWWSPDGLTWVPASEPPAADTVLRTADGWLAWGGADVWSTSDGDRWQHLGSLSDVDGIESRDAIGFVPLGTCLLAADHAWIREGGDERYVLRMWLSAGGRDWAPLTPQLPDSWNDGDIWGLTSTGDAVIAWGSKREGDRWIDVTLRSVDLRTWELGGTGLQVRDYQHDTIRSIAAGPSGLVAVGASLAGEAGEPGLAAAWTSVDGLDWTPARLEPPASVDALSDVIWDGDRFVAFGRPGLDQEVWLSADGRTWRRAASVPDAALDGAEDGCTGSAVCPRSWIAGASAGSGAVVAFGMGGPEGSTGGAILWTSPRLLVDP
jgi:hypothetical protein